MENPYDDEESTGSITIWFADTSHPALDDPDTHITDTEQQDLEHAANPGDSLNNTGNIYPDNDHITIRITGVNDPVPINSTINENPIEESNDDDIDDMEQTGVEDHNPNNNTEPINHDPRRSNQIRIPNQGVEQTGDIEFEYINLQGACGDLESYSPEEMIVWIDTPKERKN